MFSSRRRFGLIGFACFFLVWAILVRVHIVTLADNLSKTATETERVFDDRWLPISFVLDADDDAFVKVTLLPTNTNPKGSHRGVLHLLCLVTLANGAESREAQCPFRRLCWPSLCLGYISALRPMFGL